MKPIKQIHLGVGAMALAVSVTLAPASHASFVVAPGFDLLETVTDGTFFAGVNWEGIPENVGDDLCGERQFNFGAGCEPTGNTDSIIQRLEEASVGGDGETATIDIELVALSLRSVEPINILGQGDEYVHARILKDLVSGDYLFGSSFGSTMSITFDNMLGGTFTSVLNLIVDLIGESSGAMGEAEFVLGQDNALWDREPHEGAVIIPRINRFLNGQNSDDDFWSKGRADHCDGPNKCHSTDPATIPVPASLPLMAGALALVGAIAAKRRRKVAS